MPPDSRADKAWTPTAHGQDGTGGGLQRRVARGLMWTLIDTWGSQLLAFVVFAILARLIDPVDFGLVTLAAVFVALGQLFVDEGLGDAVIQRPTLTTRQLDTAFWATLLTGALIAVGGVVLAPLIARLLGDARLEQILQVLSLLFVLVSLTSIQMGLLRRELDFRGLAIRKLLAIGIGGVVGIAMAVSGFGAWALVGQQVAAAAVSVVALWAVTPWRPSFQFSMTDFRSLFSFGLKVMATDLLAFLSRNVDRLLIGVFLGLIPLGFYAVAFRILDTSQILLVAATRRLIFPTFSRLQHDLARARAAYLRVTRASAALTVPGYIGLVLVAHEAIVVIFGQKWAPSATTAAILFSIGPALSLQAFSGAVWNAVGQPGVSLRFRLISTVVNIVGFLLAVIFLGDIAGVAAAFAIRAYLLLPLNLHWMSKYASVPVRDQLRQWLGVAVATAVMAAAVLGVKFLLVERLHAASLLVVEVVTGVVVYALALFVVERRVMRELVGLVLQVIPGAERVARRLGVRVAPHPKRRHRRGRVAAADELPDEADEL